MTAKRGGRPSKGRSPKSKSTGTKKPRGARGAAGSEAAAPAPPAVPAAAARARPAAAPPPAGAYLYGIVRYPVPWDTDAPTATLGGGVGEPPAAIGIVPHRALAALVSRVLTGAVGSAQGVRGLRRDMKAHANVLNRLVSLGVTVLPVQFGVVLPDEKALVADFLEPQYRALEAHLKRLEGNVEITLKVSYVEQSALQEVVAESPDLARRAGALQGRGPSRNTYQSKIDLGKRIADALRAKRDRDGRRILAALAPAVRDVKLKEPGADLEVLSGSFLVGRDTLPKFDQLLADMNSAAAGRLAFDCVGPLPPYSFVGLRL